MNNGLPGTNMTDTVTGGKTLELSKYDKVRQPHKAVTDDTKIKITARSLSTELCCPICLDLLTCTMTTKECLHRFCSECITTALMRGNKECPTCRKKIVSKRSLRPDPNFDFLISKIWPDRRLYDAELNASMQVFQEQSNMASLQKSIEEGIKAQAAYRKQRVQGSYDYEKKKRRPKQADSGAASTGAGQSSNLCAQGPSAAVASSSAESGSDQNGAADVAAGDLLSASIEQVVVSLTPAHVPMEGVQAADAVDSPSAVTRATISPSSDESDTSSDTSSDESSDLSSESTLSDSSSDVSTPSTMSASRALLITEEPKAALLAQSPLVGASHSHSLEQRQSESASPALMDLMEVEQQMGLDSTSDETRRRSEDIEVELVPSKALLSAKQLPTQLCSSRFVRAPPDITMAHIGELLFQLASQPTQQFVPVGEETAAASPPPQQQADSPQMRCRPEHIYILDRQHLLHKMGAQETLGAALAQSVAWEQHLVLFYELDAAAEDAQTRELADVVGDQMAKWALAQRKGTPLKAAESVEEHDTGSEETGVAPEEERKHAAEEAKMELDGE